MFLHRKIKASWLVFLCSVVLACDSVFAAGIPAAGGSSSSVLESLFDRFIVSGGPIVWFILLPMSGITVYLFIYLFFSISRRKLVPEGISESLVNVFGRHDAAGFKASLSSGCDLVSMSIARVFAKSEQIEPDRKYMRHLASESLNEHCVELMRRVNLFSIIGNVSPMVGLFGTVYGMIKAFTVLGVSGGQPDAEALALAISEALVTTFWGLLIAIPALVFYGIFTSKLESISSEAAVAIEMVVNRIIPRAEEQGRVEPNQGPAVETVESDIPPAVKKPVKPRFRRKNPISRKSH